MSAPALFAAALAAAAAPPPIVMDPTVETRLDASLRCWLGAYALPDGRYLTIAGSQGHPRNLQYLRSDGRLGRLVEQPDGGYRASGAVKLAARFEPCASGRLHLEEGGAAAVARRAPLVVRETTFRSGEVRLYGKLVLPPRGAAKALAVWIGGSNNNPEADDLTWSYELARRGVGVFVHDKRGVGGSGGEMTADLHLRAADTAAAVREARRLAPRVKRVGLIGASQGGWVAPLTDALAPVDFMVVAFAMAEGPTGQDRAVVEDQLRRAGFGDAATLGKARALTAATERIVRSNFTEGFEDLEGLKRDYAGEPWLAAIAPRSYTGVLLQITTAQAREAGPKQGLTFDYDPQPLILKTNAPQLWLLGDQDRQIPLAGALPVLKTIQGARPEVDIVVYAGADHGLIQTAEGGAERFAHPAGLFDRLAGWILTGEVAPAGRGEEVLPGARR